MPSNFVLWSTSHVLTIVVILAASLLVPFVARRFSVEGRRPFEVGFAVFIILHELTRLSSRVLVYGEPWQENLPLQLCGVSVFLLAAMLVRPHVRSYELLYFWGLGGTLQAVVTPDIPMAYPHPLYLGYFIYHGAVIVGALYGTFVFGLRPTLKSMVRVFITTVIYAFGVIMPINLLLGTNYLYLSHKPEQASIIDHLGPWPWYIASLAVVAWISFFVYYVPFLIYDRYKAWRGTATEPGLSPGS